MQVMKAPKFLLVGNAPYSNRGCEAIVRGTTRILDAAFGEGTAYLAASFGTEATIAEQAQAEECPRLKHAWLAPKSRASLDYLKHSANRAFGFKFPCCLSRLPADLPECAAALQVGGDNYSLDYGYPRSFMQIDRWVEHLGLPLVLWGASVGPFDKDPRFEQEMAGHLSRFRLITVRESRSYVYLQGLGLKNTVLVADPAFLMQPQPVSDCVLPPAFLGLNFSPLTANKATAGNLTKWQEICSAAVEAVLARSDLPILLIPHVVTPVTANDDYAFLQAVARNVKTPARVTVLKGAYSAAQLKWVISKATVFAGARTHSTIAGLSTGVPTLSLAYSVKAWGINEDIFGHAEHCLDVRALLQPSVLADRIEALLKQNATIRRELSSRLPAIYAKSQKAGTVLKERLELPK